MSRFLDIIVPEYNCKESFMDRLLQSIIRQKKVNLKEIGVIIINDNSPKKYKNGFFKKYPQLNIEYYKKEINEGVGMTRQYGLDKSNAEYITFVDQDDELFGDDSLAIVISELKQKKPKLLLTKYVEEVLGKDSKIEYFQYSAFDAKESLHGVFINRHEMIVNDIRFVPGIRYHDDFYIRRILTTVLDTSTLDVNSYLWKYNDDSQVRVKRDSSYQVETFDDFLRAVDERINYFDRKNIYVNELSVCSILMLFFILQFDDFTKSYLSKDECEKKLYELICKNSDKFESVREQFNDYYNMQAEYYKKTRDYNQTSANFWEFVNLMSKKYPEIVYELNTQTAFLSIIISYNQSRNSDVIKTIDSILCQKNIDRKKYIIYIVGKDEECDLPPYILNGKYEQYVNMKVNYLVNRTNISDYQYCVEFLNSQYVVFLKSGDIMYEYTSLYKIYNELVECDYELLETQPVLYDVKTNSISKAYHIDLYGKVFQLSVLKSVKSNFQGLGLIWDSIILDSFCSDVSKIKKNEMVYYVLYDNEPKYDFIKNIDKYVSCYKTIISYMIDNNYNYRIILKYIYLLFISTEFKSSDSLVKEIRNFCKQIHYDSINDKSLVKNETLEIAATKFGIKNLSKTLDDII